MRTRKNVNNSALRNYVILGNGQVVSKKQYDQDRVGFNQYVRELTH